MNLIFDVFRWTRCIWGDYDKYSALLRVISFDTQVASVLVRGHQILAVLGDGYDLVGFDPR
jgi:hypothetical protein